MRPAAAPAASLLLALASLAPLAAAGADPAAAKDPRNLTWVEEGVFALGGGGLNESDVDWLYAQGFRAIADFRAEHEDPAAYIAAKGMTFLDMPVDSAAHLNATRLETFIAWAREQQEAGRPTYIHCTNGWHRAAAFAVAWEMAAHGEGYDEAAEEAAARRPGTVMRAVSALLDHQATLSGLPQVGAILVSPATRPEPNATMLAHVDVVAGGAPAANASVRVWSEESRLRIEGTTDASGRFTFLYQAPADAFMDHLYARASLPGYVDGADNVEFLFVEPIRARGPLEVVATREGADLVVSATAKGKPVPTRFVAMAPGWSVFESSEVGVVRFREVPADAIEVRAASWGSEGGGARVDALPAASERPVEPEAQPPAEPEQPPSVSQPPPVVEPAQGGAALPPEHIVVPAAPARDGRSHALAYAAAGLVGAGVLALCVLASRRRWGAGRS